MSIVQEHFSESYLTPIIKKLFKNDIEIKNIDISYAVPPGENYICELLRFVVYFSQKNKKNVQLLSLIGKQLLDNDTVLKLDNETNFFNRELSVYDEIFPFFEKLEFKKKVAAETYYLTKEPKKLLVIEDLSASGYKMANRHEGLNLEHCLLAIERLAYFHAVSLLIYEKNPQTITQFNEGLFKKTKPKEKMLEVTFPETRNACKREPSLQKYYAKMKEDIVEKFYMATNRDSNFNVLNHGDFWCNNMMFQYNADGKLKDVVFVDFQLSVFTSPCFDLHYFIATSISHEVLKNHVQTILNHYYDSFTKNVRILKVKTQVPDRKDFNKDFRDKAFIGLASVCLCLGFMKANKRKDATLINFLENGGEGSFRHSCFTNTAYISTLQCLLSFYDSLGVFDY